MIEPERLADRLPVCDCETPDVDHGNYGMCRKCKRKPYNLLVGAK